MSRSISIQERTSRLVDVAMGRTPADLVIKNGVWVCVQTGELIPNTDIAISGERIAFVGPDASHAIGDDTRIIDASGYHLVPGLLDGHLHVESGMITVTEFVRAVARRGTTCLFIDPHEIANIFGLDGVRLMVEEAKIQPVHVWVQIPSCVPSAPGLETAGSTIGPLDVKEAMTWDGIIGLGEVMNFPGVFNSDEKMHAEMAETRAAGKVVGGHYASPDLGLAFHGYAAGSPEDDHEGTNLEDALARVRQGMKVMMRYGSAWHDVEAQVKAVTELGLDARNFILCTDDSHSETLVNHGHMDRVIRVALEQNLDPMKAIQMATINTAEHFHLSRDVGMIAPGRYADVLLVKELENFRAKTVIAKGQLIAENEELTIDIPGYQYPDWATHSVHLRKEVTPEDFRITGLDQGVVTANVIGIIENQAPTRHLKMEVPVKGGDLKIDLADDLAKVAILERHKGTGEIQIGLVHGFGLNIGCAIGSTVAHDSHQMIIMGTNDADMALAANTLADINGGQVVVKDGEVIAMVELPIGGLMSNQRAEVVAEKAGKVLAGFKECGCKINNPNMQLSLLALVVIPELRISDLGIVDVQTFDFVPLIED